MANKKFESNAVFNGEVEATKLKVTAAGGDEGGEIFLAKPATNTTIAGTGVTVDVWQNKLRFFEQGGDARGYYLDITGGSAGVGTNIIGGGSASDSFKTISVTGQDNVVADSSTDTLSLVAGTNVSITTNATADSITINSTGNFTSVDSIKYPDYITFDTTPETEPTEAGSLWWNPDFETLNVQLDSAVTLQVGQEHVVRVKNDSASVAIPEMRVVMFAGATGDTVEATPAISTASYDPHLLIGVTTEEIPADGFGFVTQFGFINKVDTSTPGWSLGDLLYADPANAGLLTNVKPSAPNWNFPIAAVTRVHALTGRILVRTIPGQHLNDLVDVGIDSPADNEVLAYDTTSGTWKNQTAVEAGLQVIVSGVTDTEIGYLNGVTSSIQTQIDGRLSKIDADTYYQPLDGKLTSLVAITGTAGFTRYDGDGTFSVDSNTYLTTGNAETNYLAKTDATTLYQSKDQDLTDIAALSANGILKKTAGVWGMDTSAYLTSFTESDPVFTAHPANGVTSTKIENWDAAFGWGNHAGAGYSLSSHNHTLNSLSNVVITGTPTGGQAIVWDSTTSKWVNEPVGEAIVKTTTTDITSSSATTIATFPLAYGKCIAVECVVLISSESTGSYYASKVLITADPDYNAIADITEYAIMDARDDSLFPVFTASISGENVLLRAEVSSIAATTAKVVSTSILSPLGAA